MSFGRTLRTGPSTMPSGSGFDLASGSLGSGSSGAGASPDASGGASHAEGSGSASVSGLGSREQAHSNAQPSSAAPPPPLKRADLSSKRRGTLGLTGSGPAWALDAEFTVRILAGLGSLWRQFRL